ncbi:STAS-like domain-containing protein [Microbacterium aurum]|uniref:STAS-like domain-containing protein n=1 Tax=Microbacterium aurum TaxID=36805 RepID=UPI001EF53B53|nr:STAS-like domain-containing protein [Microbacterium aurum]MCG7415868.1 STAS-like domain-containing protein [Microbacterium aurum]
MTTKRIKIEPVAGTLLAESKDEARELRVNTILPALERGDQVELDFTGVGFATQSFVHALISEAVRIYQDAAFDRLSFLGCSDEVRQVILTVFEYTIEASDAAGTDPRGSRESPTD